MRTCSAILTVLLVFTFSCASADETATIQKRKKVVTPARVDRNRDGVIGPAEQARANHLLRKRNALATANSGAAGNTTISTSTRATATVKKQVVDTEAEEAFDKNDDGILNRREKNAMRWNQQQDDNNDGTVTAKELADTNNNGTVDTKEAQRAKDRKEQAEVDTPTEEQFDANNDGTLNRQEARRMNRFNRNDTRLCPVIHRARR